MTFRGSHVDVLIIGAGPAGSMLSTLLVRNGITTRIVDKRNASLVAGQADGINQRSLEIMQSLGLIYEIQSQAGVGARSSGWIPDGPGKLKRNGEAPNFVRDSLSEFSQLCTMNQGRIERMLQANAKLYSDNDVERGILPMSLKIDESQAEDDDTYPVEVVVQHLTEDESTTAQIKAFTRAADHVPSDGFYRSNIGPSNHTEELAKKVSGRKKTEEVVRARYVVGCDGAWSWTRNQLGIEMVGAKIDSIWGVLDIIPKTDFPDARDMCMIQSEMGSILWIPREHGLVRLYTQLSEVKPDEDGSVDRSKITPDHIFDQAKKILQPYNIEYRYCDWWTAYQVGQRVGEAYHDPHHRVFLAGDAVHTHSPKEGLGMNTSMQDTWNLAWKLASVINKQSPRSILHSYQSERRPVAQQLIDFDRSVSAAFSGKPDPNFDIRDAYMKQIEFMGGFAIQYPPSNVASDVGTPQTNGSLDSFENGTTNGHVSTETTYENGIPKATGPGRVPSVATRLHIGRRVPPVKVKQHTGGTTNTLLKLLPFDGRWRLIVFPGDVRDPSLLSRANTLGAALDNPKTGLLHLKHTLHLPLNVPFPYALGSEVGRKVQATEKEVPLVDVLTVHASTWGQTELSEFHDVFWPMDEDLGRAYGKIHFGDEAYEILGIEKGKGAMVLVRPDQHVAWIGEVGDVKGLRRFAEGCMLL